MNFAEEKIVSIKTSDGKRYKVGCYEYDKGSILDIQWDKLHNGYRIYYDDPHKYNGNVVIDIIFNVISMEIETKPKVVPIVFSGEDHSTKFEKCFSKRERVICSLCKYYIDYGIEQLCSYHVNGRFSVMENDYCRHGEEK